MCDIVKRPTDWTYSSIYSMIGLLSSFLISCNTLTNPTGTHEQDAYEVFHGQFAALITVTVDQELPIIGLSRSTTHSAKLFTVTQDGEEWSLEEKVCRIEVESEGPASPVMRPELIETFPTLKSKLLITRGEGGWSWSREKAGLIIGAELAQPLTDLLPITSDDPRLVDLDRDGHPGVTIPLTGVLKGELHSVLRYVDEINGFVSDNDRGLWKGVSTDYTEQSVVASSHEFLLTQFPTTQVDDQALNRVLVFPLSGERLGCEQVSHELIERDLLATEALNMLVEEVESPFGNLCDGSPASVYDEQLLERTDCGHNDPFVLPPSRIELTPHLPSPYETDRCGELDFSFTDQEILDCAEIEFWHAFSDGRLEVRETALSYLTLALTLVDTENLDLEHIKHLGRLYMLRGMFYMAMGLENGVSEYLIESEHYSSADFDRVEALDQDNFAVIAFDLTLEMTLAGIAGHHMRAAEIANEGLDYVLSLGDPEVIEDKNVGAVLGLSGTSMTWPLQTGIPQKTLDAVELVGCPDDIEFCQDNTLHAPYARPGLEYHKAELYARMGMESEYREQLEIVADQPNYNSWPWKDVVELQRQEPTRLLEKYRSYGEDGYAQSYATMSSGCVMCHGR